MRVIKSSFGNAGTFETVKHGAICQTIDQAAGVLASLELRRALEIRAMGNPPAGYDVAWIQNWEPSVMRSPIYNDKDERTGMQFKVTSRGVAVFVRSDFVGDVESEDDNRRLAEAVHPKRHALEIEEAETYSRI